MVIIPLQHRLSSLLLLTQTSTLTLFCLSWSGFSSLAVRPSLHRKHSFTLWRSNPCHHLHSVDLGLDVPMLLCTELIITLLVHLLHWNVSRVRVWSLFTITCLPSSRVWPVKGLSQFFLKTGRKRRGRVDEGTTDIQRRHLFYYSTCSQIFNLWGSFLNHNFGSYP